jgi:hypothetical protein
VCFLPANQDKTARQKDKQDKIRQNEKTVLSCKIAMFDFVSS